MQKHKYKVVGANKQTGTDSSMTVIATSVAEAEQIASDRGMFVSDTIRLNEEVGIFDELLYKPKFDKEFYTQPQPQPQPQPASNSNSDDVNGKVASGIILLVLGLFLLIIFAFFYDTTVSSGYGYSSVHNIGLQQNRMIGSLSGIASITIGIILIAIGSNKPKN